MPSLQVLFAPVLFLCLVPLFGLSQNMSLAEIRSKLDKVAILQYVNVTILPSLYVYLSLLSSLSPSPFLLVSLSMQEYSNVLFGCYKVHQSVTSYSEY